MTTHQRLLDDLIAYRDRDLHVYRDEIRIAFRDCEFLRPCGPFRMGHAARRVVLVLRHDLHIIVTGRGQDVRINLRIEDIGPSNPGAWAEIVDNV